MKRKTLSMLMSVAMTVSTILGSISTMAVPVAAATEEGVTDEDCTTTGTEAPAADEVVPDANQYKYQKDELAAFCHFGPNTFSGYEWGFNQGTQTWLYQGQTPDQIFQLEDDFDAYNYVQTLKNAGFKKVIVTAKHHDGFCIWDSKWTEYDIASTSYYQDRHKEGDKVSGDILAEISKACTDLGLDMGLYLSPWDVAESTYGADGGGKDNAYNDYYNNQLEEILSSEQYGRDGHFVEVWMDGANGYNNRPQSYDFVRWFNTIQQYEGIASGDYEEDCMLFGAGAYTTVRWIGNESGLAAEDTWSKSTVDYGSNSIDSNTRGDYTVGLENGNKWTVPECDGRITSGWFWGTGKCTPKTISDLANMYFDSVGHNSTMLLNVPPNNKGTVDEAILDRVEEFGQEIQDTFRTNLAESATVVASNVRGNDEAFKPGTVVDGDDATYWTTDDANKSGTLTLKWDTAKKFDVVSIEEAIQNGQHINSYKVEYKTSDDAAWQTLKEGQVIGAKRLIRTSPVSATQVRITVGTTEGKVPMISEVGVYKASAGFQLSGAAPDGMDTVGVDDSAFSFTGTWNPQTGTQYINGQNTWSSTAGAAAELTFTGTKIYLMGTQDPGHGEADIYIDGTLVETINTNATSRSTGSVIFKSEDLTDGQHTIKLVTKKASSANGAIGLEAAYIINNGGKGMVEIEQSAYTMNEDSELSVTLKRVGGSVGTITVNLEPNPGSAIQKHFDTNLITEVTFEDGETEKVIAKAAKSNRVETADGDVYFTLNLTSAEEVIGMQSSAKVTIKDADGMTLEKLNTLVTACEELEEHLYTSGWSAFAKALTNAKAATEETSESTLNKLYTALETARDELVARENYTEEDRFQFPSKMNKSAVLEAEFATLTNVDNEHDHQWGTWPLEIKTADWASNGKFVNSFNYEDTIAIPYNAEKAGTYSVTVFYRSGSGTNGLTWSATEDKITAGSVTAGATDGAGATHEVTFDMVVATPGEGVLTFTSPETDSPQVDKFVIVPKDLGLEEYEITATAGEGGTITAEGLTEGKVTATEGDDVTFTITATDGYAIADVKVDGESVGAVDSYTFSDLAAAHTIEATFTFSKYTAAAPFQFPTEKGTTVTLEAEHATNMVNSDDSDSDPDWDLSIGAGDWASNGKFVNCLAYKDYIYYAYNAEKTGTYTVTAYYRSGSNDNRLAWSETDNKIEAGQTETLASTNEGGLQLRTFTFELKITEAGAGTLILTAPDTGKGPQLDKFEIVYTRTSDESDLAALQTAITNAENAINDSNAYAEAAVAELQALVNEAKEMTSATPQADVDAKAEAITAKIADMQTRYTIKATAGANGSISPKGSTKVYKGTDKTFTITADEGYHIESITVDGTAVVEIVEEYTFENVTAGHTISVTFALDNPFEDVVEEENKYYYDAVLWAVKNEITTGVTATTFCPDNACTRAQVVMFLWKAAGQPEHSQTENPFSDLSANSRFYDAIMWAYENGITKGYTDGSFRPDEPVRRAEYITFQWRAAGEPEATKTTEFSDVSESVYPHFYDAIQWAAEKQITLGKEGKFLPETRCSRGDVVTFLYRGDDL